MGRIYINFNVIEEDKHNFVCEGDLEVETSPEKFNRVIVDIIIQAHKEFSGGDRKLMDVGLLDLSKYLYKRVKEDL